MAGLDLYLSTPRARELSADPSAAGNHSVAWHLASRLSSYSRSRRSIEPEATRPVLRIRTSRGAEGLDEDKQRQCIEWQSVKRLVEAGNLGYSLSEGTCNQSVSPVVMQTGTSCINLIEKEEGLERKLMPVRTRF